MKVINAIVCDDVRVEQSGKHMFIGVFTGAIHFYELPAVFAPVFWIELEEHLAESEIDIEFKCEAPGLKKPRFAKFHIAVKHKGGIFLNIQMLPFEVTCVGELKCSIREAGTSRWTTALKKEIVLGSA